MFKRSERVSELLRHEISSFIQEVTDPHLGFVTITGVKVTDDLKEAKIYYSVFGSDEEKQATSEVLRKLVHKIHLHLGRKLESLYRPPSLHFVYDVTPENAQRLTDLLKQISKEEKPSAPPGSPEDEK